ncbi:hypothetical protein J437_LFUL005113 [Ladona fulva]|uniref:Uncharacterized protein n=1 Tax=Ladona fulva TaxID=123851 RepID=A0A8K0JXW3_LADFU|nr:hypothetical protein J437_LFUL005112 [Ladona fulva]KAG8224671.1 hypothetical protein J437_LFUL005113 [Ladona fulva]
MGWERSLIQSTPPPLAAAPGQPPAPPPRPPTDPPPDSTPPNPPPPSSNPFDDPPQRPPLRGNIKTRFEPDAKTEVALRQTLEGEERVMDDGENLREW